MNIPNCYSVVIIKPDAHKDILTEMILRDIEEGGLEIVLRKDLSLSEEQAEMIYRDEKNKEKQRYATKSLLLKEGEPSYVTVVIVKSAEGFSALAMARELKGKSGKSGIRSKYQLHTKEALIDKYETRHGLKSALAENRLHVPDTDDDALEIINSLMSLSEKSDLKERAPRLYAVLPREDLDVFDQNTELIRKRRGYR